MLSCLFPKMINLRVDLHIVVTFDVEWISSLCAVASPAATIIPKATLYFHANTLIYQNVKNTHFENTLGNFNGTQPILESDSITSNKQATSAAPTTDTFSEEGKSMGK
ncbi:hypothetical protein GJ496_002783 [Pomphorhynchus laevis]|nr:hypothetical protein GJ496_002783 [Pomphorhynchus laevis]